MRFILISCLILLSPLCKAQDFLDIAYVKTPGDQWQLIAPDGKVLADSLFEHESMAVLQCNEGMAITEKDGKYGFRNLVDATFIAHRFDTVTAFKNGRAAVRINNNWYWLARNGKQGSQVLTAAELATHMRPSDAAVTCKEGYCLIETDSTINCKGPDGRLLLTRNDPFVAPWNDVNSFINDRILTYKVMANKICSCNKLTNYYGFADKSGQWTIAPEYEQADIFSLGLASVSAGTEGIYTYGYIDRNGTWKINPVYKEAGRFTRIALK